MIEKWDVLYRRLREREPEIYHKAIQYAEGCSLNHNIELKAAADIEKAFVVFALELTGGVN